ncbi:MAG: heme exporter protein CcmD [Pseudomonadota bacterium]
MYFDNLNAVINMAGHGAFVWAAYGISLLVVLFILIAPVRRRSRILLRLSGEVRRQQSELSNAREVN